MARFISQVFIVVEADSESEACDAMSGALSENLKYGGAIVDWSYAKRGAGWDHPSQVTEPFASVADIENEDFDSMHAAARAASTPVDAVTEVHTSMARVA